MVLDPSWTPDNFTTERKVRKYISWFVYFYKQEVNIFWFHFGRKDMPTASAIILSPFDLYGTGLEMVDVVN